MVIFSPLILGTMRWGIWGANFSVSETQKYIAHSFDLGLTSFDCADIYGDYTTEELVGTALKNLALDREKVQIISKCGIQKPGENRDFTVKSYNYTAKHIIESVKKSLKNLQTDYLDLLLLHRPSPLMNPLEICETFQKLKNDGRVREFGVSNFTVSQFNLIDQYFPLSTNQLEFSLTHTGAFYDGSLDQLMLKKLRPMAWSPLGDYFSEKNKNHVQIKSILKVLCEKYECEESAILIAFLLKHPSKILPVLGTTKVNNLKNILKALEISLEIEDWFKLLEAAKGHPVP